MAELRLPVEWAAEMKMEILDPDGWRRPGDPPFDQPITLDDFLPRMWMSTLRSTVGDPDKFNLPQCRSGCKTQDHASYGECLRESYIAIGNLK